MSALIDFPVGVRRGPGRVLERKVAFDPASAAVPLLREADRALLEAEWEAEPTGKFTSAYLAALRGAAAMLALRGRPHRGRSKPTSAWLLLSKVAPELGEWAEIFAAVSPVNAAVSAGIHKPMTPGFAEDMVRKTGQFLAVVERAMTQREP
ncbi:SAV_6107 family HEPN domain-containing protein [Sciscionella sediminilitoris]|uniref:SAV_6107 family HEPN domain-containing protein n=1 Tax=Sciscionella sediminilitoris TaxID=1445613 RepID=UPI0009E8D860|nr:SAV_6107 family HEPN domain-containing protein [Sciscionella sp. SE31]